MQAKDWRFPMPCPSCKAKAGAPFRAQVGHGAITIDLQCDTCQHQWTTSAPSPSTLINKVPAPYISKNPSH